MKKPILMLLAALLLLMPLTALADVIYEPRDDFFEAHRDDCVYVGRSYLTNGPDGAVVIWDDPESGVSRHAVRNGVSFYISHTYAGDGGTWGIVEYGVDEAGRITNSYNEDVGWVSMDEMLLEYDSQAFMDAHKAELMPYTGDYEAIVQAGDDTILWSYPGSGVTAGTLYEASGLTFEQAYTDEEGRLWGYVGYHYGIRDLWVCVSDPANAGIPAAAGPAVDLHPANPGSEVMKALGDKQAAPIRLKSGESSLLRVIVIVLVVTVVVVTAIFITVLMKKKGR